MILSALHAQSTLAIQFTLSFDGEASPQVKIPAGYTKHAVSIDSTGAADFVEESPDEETRQCKEEFADCLRGCPDDAACVARCRQSLRDCSPTSADLVETEEVKERDACKGKFADCLRQCEEDGICVATCRKSLRECEAPEGDGFIQEAPHLMMKQKVHCNEQFKACSDKCHADATASPATVWLHACTDKCGNLLTRCKYVPSVSRGVVAYPPTAPEEASDLGDKDKANCTPTATEDCCTAQFDTRKDKCRADARSRLLAWLRKCVIESHKFLHKCKRLPTKFKPPKLTDADLTKLLKEFHHVRNKGGHHVRRQGLGEDDCEKKYTACNDKCHADATASSATFWLRNCQFKCQDHRQKCKGPTAVVGTNASLQEANQRAFEEPKNCKEAFADCLRGCTDDAECVTRCRQSNRKCKGGEGTELEEK